MDENDIIIMLADYLRNLKEKEFSVVYANADEALGLPEGSAAKHIEVAAKDVGLNVTRKGSTRISIRRPSEFGFA
jgi:hypothetical protein